MTTEQMIEEALIDMEKHYCRLNGQDDGYLVKKTTMREILTTIATKSAERAVLDYILSLMWQDTENEYVKEVLNDAEEIAKSLYQKDTNE